VTGYSFAFMGRYALGWKMRGASQQPLSERVSCPRYACPRYALGSVPKTDASKLQKPKVDPHLQSDGERVKAAADELVRLGIADRTGKRIRKDLPKDMRTKRN
jgi:hypothetical protein